MGHTQLQLYSAEVRTCCPVLNHISTENYELILHGVHNALTSHKGTHAIPKPIKGSKLQGTTATNWDWNFLAPRLLGHLLYVCINLYNFTTPLLFIKLKPTFSHCRKK